VRGARLNKPRNELNVFRRIYLFYQEGFEAKFCVPCLHGIVVCAESSDNIGAVNQRKLPFLVFKFGQFGLVGFQFFFKSDTITFFAATAELSAQVNYRATGIFSTIRWELY